MHVGVFDRGAHTFPRGGGDVGSDTVIALEVNGILTCRHFREVNILFYIVSGGMAKLLYPSTFEETPHINLIKLYQVLNSLGMQIKLAMK